MCTILCLGLRGLSISGGEGGVRGKRVLMSLNLYSNISRTCLAHTYTCSCKVYVDIRIIDQILYKSTL